MTNSATKLVRRANPALPLISLAPLNDRVVVADRPTDMRRPSRDRNWKEAAMKFLEVLQPMMQHTAWQRSLPLLLYRPNQYATCRR